MQNKKNKGLTLIELIIVIGIMGFIIAGLMGFVFFMFDQYRTDQIIATDQVNIRVAMLGITRQIRRGVDVEINEDGDFLTLIYDAGGPDETRANYFINPDGFLIRDVVSGSPDNLISFVGTEMQEFRVERLNSDGDPAGRYEYGYWVDYNDGNWLRITLTTSRYATYATVSTTISIDRIAQ